MDSFEMPAPTVDNLKFRLTRMNPLIVDPGQHYILCGRQLDENGKFTMYQARLEWSTNDIIWKEVEFHNEMVTLQTGNI